MIVIQLIHLVSGPNTPFDGMYLLEYDPSRDGVDPANRKLTIHLKCTASIKAAKHFNQVSEAVNFVQQVDPRQPVRQDGQPNRPLTAFTIALIESKENQPWEVN